MGLLYNNHLEGKSLLRIKSSSRIKFCCINGSRSYQITARANRSTYFLLFLLLFLESLCSNLPVNENNLHDQQSKIAVLEMIQSRRTVEKLVSRLAIFG